MKISVAASAAIAAIFVFLGVNVAAHSQLAVKEKLAQIDRTFVCPESLPSDDARKDAVKLFLEELAAGH